MPSMIQRKHLDEIRVKVTKRWGKNCEAKHGLVEESQNQNGVVFFSKLKHAAKIVLVKLDIHYTCKYSLTILRTYTVSVLVSKKVTILFDKNLVCLPGQYLNFL